VFKFSLTHKEIQTMTHIVSKRPDGGISVTVLSPEFIAAQAKKGIAPQVAAEAHHAELCGRGDLPAGTNCCGVDVPLPADREFRDAWDFDSGNNKVAIHAAKAVECTKNRLRAERAPKLEELDIEYQRKDEAGDAQGKADIAAQKQALRDAPATVPAAPEGMTFADDAFLAQLRACKCPE
jgi:hypothetical protein